MVIINKLNQHRMEVVGGVSSCGGTAKVQMSDPGALHMCEPLFPEGHPAGTRFVLAPEQPHHTRGPGRRKAISAQSNARVSHLYGVSTCAGFPGTGSVHHRNRSYFYRKRAARTVLTETCYSVSSATRQGSSSLTRLTGQSAMTSRTWRR